MNGKKMLLVACLCLAWSTVAPAQGLVGAPVDPRYGSGTTGVGDAPSKNPPPSPSTPGGTAMAAVAIAVLAAVRVVVR
jgi:hypothetical protein